MKLAPDLPENFCTAFFRAGDHSKGIQFFFSFFFEILIFLHTIERGRTTRICTITTALQQKHWRAARKPGGKLWPAVNLATRKANLATREPNLAVLQPTACVSVLLTIQHLNYVLGKSFVLPNRHRVLTASQKAAKGILFTSTCKLQSNVIQ